MKFTIRRAVVTDCGQMMELIRELAVFEKAPDAVTVTLQHFTESGFGKNPVWQAFVAAAPAAGGSKEKLLGLSLYYIRYSTWKGQRLYLEDILVNEPYRGKGIGKLLFDQLVEEAKEKKFNRIIWQVLDWNEPAINFYRKYNADFDASWVNCSIYV